VGAALAEGADLEDAEAESLSEHARRNRAVWDAMADEWVEPGRRNWARNEPTWGLWRVPESELNVLGETDGKDVIELGCGTAYWSSYLARRGARVIGVDNSARQLETARALQQEFGVEFPLVHASAEDVPLPDASFDIAFSEYGASIWCDPPLWIAEASRLLRPGGLFAFLVNGTLLMLCAPDDESAAGERLLRDYFGIRRFEWAGDAGVEFHAQYGEWIRILRANGLDVEALHELQAPADAPPTRFGYVTPAWAHRWPSEEIWKARKGA
jgi:SAM-dependent methyltransferase